MNGSRASLPHGAAGMSGDPAGKWSACCSWRLEREELVSVGYRETMIARRLESMPIGPQLRELIRHALCWAWKDEEMHAIYLRARSCAWAAVR